MFICNWSWNGFLNTLLRVLHVVFPSSVKQWEAACEGADAEATTADEDEDEGTINS